MKGVHSSPPHRITHAGRVRGTQSLLQIQAQCWRRPGLIARELAWRCPDKIRAVVTLGSPFSGDPKQNNVWRIYELVARHKVDDPPIPRSTAKPPVPSLALWSRKDGLIAPRSARGLDDERDKQVELNCTHMAFGISAQAARDVVREIERFMKERKLD